jgi:hypothetical protein
MYTPTDGVDVLEMSVSPMIMMSDFASFRSTHHYYDLLPYDGKALAALIEEHWYRVLNEMQRRGYEFAPEPTE